MMTETGETPTTTTTTTEAAPADEILELNINMNPNPNLNSTVDPIFFYGYTARTCTLYGICLKITFAVFAIVQAKILWAENSCKRENYSAFKSGSEGALSPQDVAHFEWNEFLGNALFWSALPFLILYFVALVGAAKEKTGFIALFILLVYLETVCGLSLVVYFASTFGTFVFGLAFVFASFLFTVGFIKCALEFRRRIDFRNSPPLESEQLTTLPSA